MKVTDEHVRRAKEAWPVHSQKAPEIPHNDCIRRVLEAALQDDDIPVSERMINAGVKAFGAAHPAEWREEAINCYRAMRRVEIEEGKPKYAGDVVAPSGQCHWLQDDPSVSEGNLTRYIKTFPHHRKDDP